MKPRHPSTLTVGMQRIHRPVLQRDDANAISSHTKIRTNRIGCPSLHLRALHVPSPHSL